jgi:hypothetical protein
MRIYTYRRTLGCKYRKGKNGELVRYAQSKNVGVILWYNSNGAWNTTPQTPKDLMDTADARRKEMEWLQQIGVKGLKIDFFGGDKQVTSSQASVALNYQKHKWLLTAEPFIKKVSGINSISQGFQDQFEFANTLGNYKVYGIEMLAQKQWRNFTGWITYQYNNNKYHFNGLYNHSFKSNQEVPHAIRSGFIYDNKHWQFALGGSWMSGRFYTGPTSRIPGFDENQNPVIVYRDPNSSQLDDYLQLNTSASFTHAVSAKIKCKAGVSIQNLFNSSETINRSYRINTQNTTIQEINSIALERTFNAFVRVYFL